MRKPGVTQEPGGQKLVVGREQGAGPVEHRDSASRERAEGPETVVDAVERAQHVETAERGVAPAERRHRLLGGNEA